jgi:ABC-type polysaccharide/polyol phosphate export permease
MLAQLRTLFRYRLLIQSLVSRELKARYRGSVLGFFWSFINPLLQLLTYGLVFTVILPVHHSPEMEPYLLFFFCGILPWTWFQSSLTESSGVLIASGNLLKKVLFPAEVLPVVSVLSNLAHFLLGLPVLLVFLAATGRLSWSLVLLPLPLLVQLVLTLGLALLVACLTVHFRDIQNILGHLLHLWFFASPVLYYYGAVTGRARTCSSPTRRSCSRGASSTAGDWP